MLADLLKANSKQGSNRNQHLLMMEGQPYTLGLN